MSQIFSLPVVMAGTGTVTSVSGGNNITITGVPTINPTVNVSGTINHDVLLGNATGSINSLTNGTTGQVLTAVTGADPAWMSLPSGGTVTSISAATGITLTPNPIVLTGTVGLTIPVVVTSGGTGQITNTNHGVLLGQGASAIVATAAGTTNTVLLGNTAADPSFGTVPNAALTNSTVTLNNGNNLTVTGGTPLALGGTASFNLTGTTQHAVQVGNASGSLTSVAVGNTNQVLNGNTGADPSFGQVPNGALVNDSITLSNGNNITVTGSPVALGGTATIAVTGTTNHSLLLGNASGSISSLGVATNGQIPIGSTGADPVLATLTAGANITITPGAGTISIASTGGGVTTITGDTGGALTGSNITFTGGTTGLSFGGAGTTETVSGILVVSNGGTGNATLTNHGVLVGAGTSAITQLAVGASGTVLIGNTASDPSFSATPTVTSITINNAPSAGTDGANKAYVDSVAAGLDFKNTCFAASTTSLTVTYANGASGIGATLTNAGAQAAFSIDGTTPVITSRILIKNQASSFQNGIYNLTIVGTGITNWVLTRSLDYNTPAQIAPGDIVPVSNGTVNADTFWLETATVTTIGTDPITFSEFFGGGAVTFNADSGSATPSAGTLTIAGGSGISTSATGSTVTVSLGSTAVQTVKLQLTSAQVKSLHATPVTVISAPGAGKTINLISVIGKMNYGGTNAFVAAAGQALYLITPGPGIVWGWVMDNTNSVISDTQSGISFGYIESGFGIGSPGFNDGPATVFENLPVQVSNNSGTEISGNAANNNTIDITLVYQILTL